MNRLEVQHESYIDRPRYLTTGAGHLLVPAVLDRRRRSLDALLRRCRHWNRWWWPYFTFLIDLWACCACRQGIAVCIRPVFRATNLYVDPRSVDPRSLITPISSSRAVSITPKEVIFLIVILLAAHASFFSTASKGSDNTTLNARLSVAATTATDRSDLKILRSDRTDKRDRARALNRASPFSPHSSAFSPHSSAFHFSPTEGGRASCAPAASIGDRWSVQPEV